MEQIENLMRWIFWVSAILVAYIYVGYPAALGILAKLFPKANKSDDLFRPAMSLLISAYNEAAVIREKLENSCQLIYPVGFSEIIVISDCSSDATDDIVKEYASRGVRLIRQPERLGKSAALNLAVPQAKGEIIVFFGCQRHLSTRRI